MESSAAFLFPLSLKDQEPKHRRLSDTGGSGTGKQDEFVALQLSVGINIGVR